MSIPDVSAVADELSIFLSRAFRPFVCSAVRGLTSHFAGLAPTDRVPRKLSAMVEGPGGLQAESDARCPIRGRLVSSVM